MKESLRSRLDSLFEPGHRSTVFRVAALLVVLAAFLIRLHRLEAVGLEGDEAYSFQAAYQSFTDLVAWATHGDATPPLYYSLLRAWYLVAGDSEFSLRFPSAMANVLTIALLIRFARLLSWRSAGLVGALLLALNPYQVWYSQEARAYTFLALFGLAAIYCCLRSLRGRTTLYYGLYLLFMSLALYTHYYAVSLLVFANILMLVHMIRETRSRVELARWMAAQAVLVVLFLPWLVFSRSVVLGYVPVAKEAWDMSEVMRETLIRHSVGSSMPVDAAFAISMAFLAIGLGGLWFSGRIGDRHPAWLRYGLAAGYLLTPIILGSLVSQVRPLFAARYLMVSAPVIFLVLGLGVVGLYRKNASVGILAGLFLLSAQALSLYNYFYDYRYFKTDFREAITYIESQIRPGDAIVLDGWTQKYQFWYYYQLTANNPVPDYLFPLGENEGWQLTTRKLDEILSRHRGVWLLDYDVYASDPERIVETYLARNYFQAITQKIQVNRVVYYASPTPADPLVTPINVSCGSDVTLSSVGGHTSSANPGDILPLSLTWRAKGGAPESYAASWRLLDPGGRTVLQRDAEPASGFSPSSRWTAGQEVIDRYGMRIPTFLPPGRYTVGVVAYHKASGKACELAPGGKETSGSLVSLGSVEISNDLPEDAAEASQPRYPARFSLGSLSMMGFEMDGQRFRPGDNITLRLFWQNDGSVGRDYKAFIRLLNAKGEAVKEQEVGLAPSWSPFMRWQPGRTLAFFTDIPVPARATSGDYTLSLTLRADGQGERSFSDFPKVSVVSRPRSFSAPSIPYASEAVFGSSVRLLGYDLQMPTKALSDGQVVHLTLYWKAIEEMAESYKVFTHLVGEDGQIYGQADSVPLKREAPTSGWAPGEILADTYDIDLRPGAPSGRYSLVVGLYEPESGKRLPLADGSADSFKVARVVVSAQK